MSNTAQIHNNLGGNKFDAMFGVTMASRNADDTALTLKFPRKNQGIACLVISLAPGDLYDVKMWNLSKITVVCEFQGLDVEQLRAAIRRETGCKLSLSD